MIIKNKDYRSKVPSQWYNLIIEVFTRKNFGRDYFTMMQIFKIWFKLVIVAIIITLVPFLIKIGGADNFQIVRRLPWSSIFMHYLTQYHFLSWYIFSVVFLFIGVIKRLRVLPSSHIEVGARSDYPGESVFPSQLLHHRELSRRTIETKVEPIVFAVLGIFFSLVLKEYVGYLFLICGGLSYATYTNAYKNGDNELRFEAGVLQDQYEVNQRKRDFIRFYNQQSQETGKHTTSEFVDDDDD